MEALDGNAIAGDLFEVFGTEMTTALGACAHCRAVAQIAELAVYLRGPGRVVRCRNCGNVVMVMVSLGRGVHLAETAFELQDPPPPVQ
jgi:hypothetical protein